MGHSSERRCGVKMTRAFRTVGFLILACGLSVRTHDHQARPEAEFVRLVAGIESNNTAAIVRAGNSRNPAFIPHLRKLLKELKKLPDETSVVEKALRKLGDKDALQEVACRVGSSHPLIQIHGMERELPEIGGWFSIKVLENSFDSNSRFKEGVEKYRKDIPLDVVLISPSGMALELLDRLVPDPSKPKFTGDIGDKSKEIAEWREWIKANQDRLSTMEPTGEGVDFSGKVCQSREYRKKEKEWRKQILE